MVDCYTTMGYGRYMNADTYDISIIDDGGFAVQIVMRVTDEIVCEANDLDSLEEAFSVVRSFYASMTD